MFDGIDIDGSLQQYKTNWIMKVEGKYKFRNSLKQSHSLKVEFGGKSK